MVTRTHPQEIVSISDENIPQHASFGERMEEDLVLILKEAFGLPEVAYTEVDKDLDHPAFARASEEDDYRKGIDFWFYSNDTWIPVDLTVTKDYSILEKKLEKERRRGIKVLQLEAKDMFEAIPTTDEDIPKAEKALRRIAEDLKRVLH